MGPSIRIDGDFLAGGLARLDDGRLQWGRRFASTETRGGPGPIGPRSGGFNGAVDSHRRRLSRRRPCAPRRWEASMGPSIRIDGDARGPRPYRAPQRRLQWGRRFASTETFSPAALRASTMGGFNGAVDSHRRRRAGAQALSGPAAAASMGPSIRIDGDPARDRERTADPVASMGPSIRIYGDVRQAHWKPVRLLASMGPSIRIDGDAIQSG